MSFVLKVFDGTIASHRPGASRKQLQFLRAVTPPYSFPDPMLAATDTSLDQWFVHEVQPHEAALRAYVRVRFPTLVDIDNLVQDTFARILKTRAGQAVRSPKALLFTMARNAAVDQLRRERMIPIDTVDNIEQFPIADERPAMGETSPREQELRLLEEAVQALPKRCREILILKKIDGLSYAEIGQRLGISPNTISAQLTIGVLRCRRFLAERGVNKGGISS